MSRFLDYIVLIEVEDENIYGGMKFSTYKQAEDYEYCMHEKYSYTDVVTVILTEDMYYAISERWESTSVHAIDFTEEQWRLYVTFLRDVIAGFKHEWFTHDIPCYE